MSTEKREGGFGVNGILGSDQCTGMITIKFNNAYRTRYFTDSGIIGTKEFVSKTYTRFKHLFNTKNEKKPKPVKGLSGIYSLKRLSEFT